jgi:hypothetical protein
MPGQRGCRTESDETTRRQAKGEGSKPWKDVRSLWHYRIIIHGERYETVDREADRAADALEEIEKLTSIVNIPLPNSGLRAATMVGLGKIIPTGRSCV